MKNTWKVLPATDAFNGTPLGVTVRLGVFFDGTGNNRYNSQVGKNCRAMAEVNQDRHSAECAGRHDDPDSSYSNELSNIAKLATIYCHRPVAVNLGDGLRVCWPIYVSGVGTLSGGRDSFWPGQSFGRGRTGVIAKVAQAVKKVGVRLELFSMNNPGSVISALELDVFGFSRGAAAARHFVNEVLKQDKGGLELVLNRCCAALSPEFSWASGSVRLKIIGLFDTVAAVGGIRDLANPRDARHDRVNLCLPPGCADQVLHLVARDEARHNFALHSVTPHWSREIVLPGAHSDIGGGYPPQMVESVTMTRPHWSRVSCRTPVKSTVAWQQANVDLATIDAKRWLDPDDPHASLSVTFNERSTSSTASRLSVKSVMTAVCMRRQVFDQLSRVYLRIMHTLCVEEGVPFLPLPQTREYALIPELDTVAAKLMAYARGGEYALSEEEELMLRRRYIHQSAHWGALVKNRRLLTDTLFIHAPRDGGRMRYLNQEAKNCRQ
jgi:hypothetical protein